MGAFDSIKDLAVNFGESISSLLQSPKAMYGIYFFAILIALYQLINLGVNRGKLEGKPAKVISIMLSIIVTGGIFFNKSTTQVLGLFTGFIGFLLILVFGIGTMIIGIVLYRNNRQSSPRAAMLYLSLGLYMGSALLLPQFGTVVNADKTLLGSMWFYEVIIKRFIQFRVIGDVLSWVNTISMILLLVSTVRLFAGLRGNNTVANMGGQISAEAQATSTMRSLMRNLDTQLQQGRTIVENLRRML